MFKICGMNLLIVIMKNVGLDLYKEIKDFKNHLIGLSKEYTKWIPLNDSYKFINTDDKLKQERLKERLE